MSMIERLEKKWDTHMLKQRFPYGLKASWWVNAIADELDSVSMPYDAQRSADWLRDQAKEAN